MFIFFVLRVYDTSYNIHFALGVSFYRFQCFSPLLVWPIYYTRVVIDDTNLQSNGCLANCFQDDTCPFDVSNGSGPLCARFNPFFPPAHLITVRFLSVRFYIYIYIDSDKNKPCDSHTTPYIIQRRWH